MARPQKISDEQILKATRRCVLTHGAGVSLDVVAADLSVTGPALLKRFGSRQKLLLAALRPPSPPEWVGILLEGPKDAPLEGQLLDIFTRIADFMAGLVPCMTALRESGIPFKDVYPAKDSGPERGIKALQFWLREACDRGLVTVPEIDTAAFAMLGALQTRAFFAHVLQMKLAKREQHDYVAELARFFARALTGDAQTTPRKKTKKSLRVTAQ